MDKDVSGSAALPLYVLLIFSLAIVFLWMLISLTILCCFSKGTLLDKLHTRQKTKKTSGSKAIGDSFEKVFAMKNAAITEGEFYVAQAVNNDTTGDFSAALPGTMRMEFYMRYIYHYFLRTVWKNLLIIFVIGGFVFCLGWMKGNIEHNENKISELYTHTTVDGKIVPQAGSNHAENGAYIYSDIIDTFCESGYIDKFILEASVSTILENNKNKEVVSTETYGIGNASVHEQIKNDTVDISYIDGYDDSVFEMSEEASDDEKMVIIVSDKIMDCFEKGKLYAVIGPSGSGKSTLLSLMAGLDKPSAGTIDLNGKNIFEMDLDAYRRQSIAMIFQNFQLLPLLTVLENVCYVMEINGVKFKDAKGAGLRGRDYPC